MQIILETDEHEALIDAIRTMDNVLDDVLEGCVIEHDPKTDNEATTHRYWTCLRCQIEEAQKKAQKVLR